MRAEALSAIQLALQMSSVVVGRRKNAPLALIEFVDRDVSAKGQVSGPVQVHDEDEAA